MSVDVYSHTPALAEYISLLVTDADARRVTFWFIYLVFYLEIIQQPHR